MTLLSDKYPPYGATTTLQEAYGNSATPEVTTDATRGALSLKRGSATDTDNVLEIENGNGDLTASINGLGELDATLTAAEFHGVVARPVAPAGNPLPTHITTTTFTLGATATPITYYYNGTKVVVSSDKTATLDDGTAGLYYVYFNGTTGNILATKNFPGLTLSSNVIIATVLWNGTDYGLVGDERHNHTRPLDWHINSHLTIGVRYDNGLTMTHNSGTGAAATFSLTTGTIRDEDIAFVVPASSDFPTANTCRILYQTGASTYSFDKDVSTTPFKLGPNNRPMYVNSADSYALTELASAPNRFINFFFYTTLDLHTPLYCFVQTATPAIINTYSNATNARAAAWPNLANSGLSPELKPIYRLVVRADGITQAFAAVDDYRTVSSLPMAAGTNATTANAVSLATVPRIEATNVQTAIQELAEDAFSGWMTVTPFTRVGDTSFTVTDNATNQETFAIGKSLRYADTIGTWHYGVVVNYTTGTVTIVGDALDTSHDTFMQVSTWAIPPSLGTTATVMLFTAGEALTAGEVCYLKSDGKMWKSDATAASTSKGLLGLCQGSVAAEALAPFTIQGLFATTGLTAGAEYFLSDTAGDIATTKPTGTGKIIRLVGYALSTTSLFFTPDRTYVELV